MILTQVGSIGRKEDFRELERVSSHQANKLADLFKVHTRRSDAGALDSYDFIRQGDVAGSRTERANKPAKPQKRKAQSADLATTLEAPLASGLQKCPLLAV